MSLLKFKHALSGANCWYKNVPLSLLEKAESVRSDMWVYNEIKRKHPKLHTELLILETSEKLGTATVKFTNLSLYSGVVTCLSAYTYGMNLTTGCFALSMGIALTGATLFLKSRSLIDSTHAVLNDRDYPNKEK